MRLKIHSRRGAVLVEFAIVGGLVLLPLIIGMAVGGVGVFRYIEVASLAREASRWASVRGAQFAADTGQAAATPASIQNFVIQQAVGLDTNQLTVTVSPITNKVTVTVSYN